MNIMLLVQWPLLLHASDDDAIGQNSTNTLPTRDDTHVSALINFELGTDVQSTSIGGDASQQAVRTDKLHGSAADVSDKDLVYETHSGSRILGGSESTGDAEGESAEPVDDVEVQGVTSDGIVTSTDTVRPTCLIQPCGGGGTDDASQGSGNIAEDMSETTTTPLSYFLSGKYEYTCTCSHIYMYVYMYM